MTDVIAITGLRVFARHGVLAHEAADGQTFVIDVAIHVDLSAAGLDDRLDSTIDYGALSNRIHDVVASERYDLIERVAQRVADVVLADDRCESVEVIVHKPQAPITVPFDGVAVRITRGR